MALDPDFMQELIAAFEVEAREHIENANRWLLELEQLPTAAPERPELLAEIFRAMHSLKGAAAAVGLPEVEDTSHRLESVLGAIRDQAIDLTSELCDLLLQTLDALDQLVNAALQGGEPPPTMSALHARLETARSDVPPPAKGEPDPVASPPRAAPGDGGSALPTEQAPPEPSRAEPAVEASPPALSGVGPVAITETIRVATNKLDALLAQTEELLVARIGLDQRVSEVRALQEFGEMWARRWQKDERSDFLRLSRSTDRAEFEPLFAFLEENQNQLRELNERIKTITQAVSGDQSRIALVTANLQDEVRQLRMLPIAGILEPLRRVARDLARELGKKVAFEIEGGEVEVDKRILEDIKDPLLHLIRNCVDHGVELPDVRAAQGKPRAGKLRLSARQQGAHLMLEIADDGQGIDVAQVREIAQRKGLASPDELEALDPQQTLNLIFLSGLSTSPIVTDLSGRGVGLDVVHENVARLQGRLTVETEVGQGTRFTLILPLRVTTAEGLLVQAGGQMFALPISAVDHIQRVSLSEVATLEAREAVLVDGHPVALLRLADLLELRSVTTGFEGATGKYPVVVVGAAEKRIALLVETLLGEQEIIVKELGQQLARVRNVAGATLLGTGDVVIVLNVADLVKSAVRMGSQPGRASLQPQAETRKMILVVDDSITTRTLERNILEAAGFDVQTATNGAEAWAILETNPVDLVVADVMMPQLDGFELTVRIRESQATRELPVILVTSLGSPEHKAKGVEVGADAYIVKKAFDQDALLATIRQLI